MSKPSPQPVWAKEFDGKFDYALIESVIKDMGDDATWLTMKKNIKSFIRHLLEADHKAIREKVEKKVYPEREKPKITGTNKTWEEIGEWGNWMFERGWNEASKFILSDILNSL